MSQCGKAEIRYEGSNPIVYQSRHNVRDDTELSTSILLALDEVADFDVESSETVVFEHVDPDSLDGLFQPVSGRRGDGEVTFPVERYDVTATAAGEITIRERAGSEQ
ncbi:HalOD1 output domain-containing protein [Halopenitus persicus]|uniref:HalOD1 output domain-containing protein n=1 Tax=Halopenitus persicus TaxID=1048396 RepID=UPI000BBA58FE|nr:HalOD1 output domain-containing protein [Halopenitus persicus]